MVRESCAAPLAAPPRGGRRPPRAPRGRRSGGRAGAAPCCARALRACACLGVRRTCAARPCMEMLGSAAPRQRPAQRGRSRGCMASSVRMLGSANRRVCRLFPSMLRVPLCRRGSCGQLSTLCAPHSTQAGAIGDGEGCKQTGSFVCALPHAAPLLPCLPRAGGPRGGRRDQVGQTYVARRRRPARPLGAPLPDGASRPGLHLERGTLTGLSTTPRRATSSLHSVTSLSA